MCDNNIDDITIARNESINSSLLEPGSLKDLLLELQTSRKKTHISTSANINELDPFGDGEKLTIPELLDLLSVKRLQTKQSMSSINSLCVPNINDLAQLLQNEPTIPKVGKSSISIIGSNLVKSDVESLQLSFSDLTINKSMGNISSMVTNSTTENSIIQENSEFSKPLVVIESAKTSIKTQTTILKKSSTSNNLNVPLANSNQLRYSNFSDDPRFSSLILEPSRIRDSEVFDILQQSQKNDNPRVSVFSKSQMINDTIADRSENQRSHLSDMSNLSKIGHSSRIRDSEISAFLGKRESSERNSNIISSNEVTSPLEVFDNDGESQKSGQISVYELLNSYHSPPAMHSNEFLHPSPPLSLSDRSFQSHQFKPTVQPRPILPPSPANSIDQDPDTYVTNKNLELQHYRERSISRGGMDGMFVEWGLEKKLSVIKLIPFATKGIAKIETGTFFFKRLRLAEIVLANFTLYIFLMKDLDKGNEEYTQKYDISIKNTFFKIIDPFSIQLTTGIGNNQQKGVKLIFRLEVETLQWLVLLQKTVNSLVTGELVHTFPTITHASQLNDHENNFKRSFKSLSLRRNAETRTSLIKVRRRPSLPSSLAEMESKSEKNKSSFWKRFGTKKNTKKNTSTMFNREFDFDDRHFALSAPDFSKRESSTSMTSSIKSETVKSKSSLVKNRLRFSGGDSSSYLQKSSYISPLDEQFFFKTTPNSNNLEDFDTFNSSLQSTVLSSRVNMRNHKFFDLEKKRAKGRTDQLLRQD